MTTATTTAPSLTNFVAPARVDLPGLCAHLDGLDEAARVAFVRSIGARQQALLYEAAAGFRPLTLDDFVPAGVAPLTQIIHSGKNSLGAFTLFEKRFCRATGRADRLFGYNEQSLKTITGPGYFVCYQIDAGQVLIDYTELPPEKPDAWPPILSNKARLSRFIYNGTKDTMRGLSKHVSVGRAARGEKWMDNWFVLCRRERV